MVRVSRSAHWQNWRSPSSNFLDWPHKLIGTHPVNWFSPRPKLMTRPLSLVETPSHWLIGTSSTRQFSNPSGHPPVDMLGVGVQLRPSRRPRLGTHGLRGLQVPAYRVAGHVQLLGNPPDRTARSFHLVDLFHFSHLQQCVSHTSAESLRMMPPLSGGSVPSCYFRPFLTPD